MAVCRCYIDLKFATAVIPATLKVWLTYGVEDGEGVKNIVLFHTDETNSTLSAFHAHCDVPLTLRINTNKEVCNRGFKDEVHLLADLDIY